MKTLTSRILQYFVALSLALTGLAVPVVAPALAAPATVDATGYVNTGRLNLRSGPHFNYGSVAMIYKGQGFTMLGRNTPATWVQVRLPSGLVGWFNVYYIKTSFSVGALPITGDADTSVSTPTTPTTQVHLGLVVTGRLNVRSGPDPFASVLTIVDKGTVLNLLGRNTSGTWAQVRAPNGVTGWVNSGYVRSNGVVKTLPITGP
jgi:uncharacterized protein YgiM (DUF1202 family)